LAAAVATFIDSFDDTSTPWGKNLINRWRVPLGSDPWSRTGDSGTPWPSGGGIWQVSTPHGPGFRMVVTDEMRVVSGGKLAFLADIGHLVGPVGSTEDWSGTVVFPAAGNPHGFPRKYLDWGVSSNSTGPRRPGGDGDRYHQRSSPQHDLVQFAPLRRAQAEGARPGRLVYGRWYSWRIHLKWSSGSDGFVKWWLDERLRADWSGPTLAAGEVPYLQFGFYSAALLHDEVFHAALRKGSPTQRPAPRKASAWIGTEAVKLANGRARIVPGCRATTGGCRGSITLARRAGEPRTRAGNEASSRSSPRLRLVPAARRRAPPCARPADLARARVPA
jgi:hypothetical protein